MPLKFCDEAFCASIYRINHTPSKVIQFETPLGKLFHVKSDYKSHRCNTPGTLGLAVVTPGSTLGS
jgi:hypothetical protein